MVTVLGEIPDREKALKEISAALKPGGIFSVTETVFDPHFQRRSTVSRLACEAGLAPTESFGNWMSFTMNFRKPCPEEWNRKSMFTKEGSVTEVIPHERAIDF